MNHLRRRRRGCAHIRQRVPEQPDSNGRFRFSGSSGLVAPCDQTTVLGTYGFARQGMVVLAASKLHRSLRVALLPPTDKGTWLVR
jgi:hypothetical protein